MIAIYCYFHSLNVYADMVTMMDYQLNVVEVLVNHLYCPVSVVVVVVMKPNDFGMLEMVNNYDYLVDFGVIMDFLWLSFGGKCVVNCYLFGYWLNSTTGMHLSVNYVLLLLLLSRLVLLFLFYKNVMYFQLMDIRHLLDLMVLFGRN